jgi:hypothetical protein
MPASDPTGLANALESVLQSLRIEVTGRIKENDTIPMQEHFDYEMRRWSDQQDFGPENS